MNRVFVSILLLALSLSGWITGGILYYLAMENDRLLLYKRLDTAFNITDQMLNKSNNSEAILNEIKIRISSGATAQTGSLKTLCKSDDGARLETIMSKEDVKKVCTLIEDM